MVLKKQTDWTGMLEQCFLYQSIDSLDKCQTISKIQIVIVLKYNKTIYCNSGNLYKSLYTPLCLGLKEEDKNCFTPTLAGTLFFTEDV